MQTASVEDTNLRRLTIATRPETPGRRRSGREFRRSGSVVICWAAVLAEFVCRSTGRQHPLWRGLSAVPVPGHPMPPGTGDSVAVQGCSVSVVGGSVEGTNQPGGLTICP